MVRTIAELLGSDALNKGVIVRDSSGRLRFVTSEAAPTELERLKLDKELIEALGAYARKDAPASFEGEPGVKRLSEDQSALTLRDGNLSFRLLDKRIIGSGWLETPRVQSTIPRRIVFASLKGGVGRSTALAIAAADLSRRSKNILVVDLDLEAPGIGELLLPEDRIPQFGTIDYLVENGLGGVSDARLEDFIGTSSLTTPGGGRVDVLPAFGKESIANPGNTLSKLARAMIEDIVPDGRLVPVRDQINDMICRFTTRESYDVVLIDSRAGLSEIAAPAILGLGATVLLFGTSQRHTTRGYSALFAALKMLAERDRGLGQKAEWRLSFKAVHAKASLNDTAGYSYVDDLYDLFAENLYDVDEESADLDIINFNIDDQSAPHWPITIPFTQTFIDFDPTRAPSQLTTPFYEQAFRPFLNYLDEASKEKSLQREVQNDF